MSGRFQYARAGGMTSPPTRSPEPRAREDTSEAELDEASAEAVDYADQIASGGLPVVSGAATGNGESCHFFAPVRFGRRRSDQVGRLELTSRCLRFHGVLDLSINWSEVAAAHRLGREIVVAQKHGGRVLRFCCDAPADAARGAAIAAHLSAAQRSISASSG